MTLGETPEARGLVSQGDSAESCQQATPLVLWRVGSGRHSTASTTSPLSQLITRLHRHYPFPSLLPSTSVLQFGRWTIRLHCVLCAWHGGRYVPYIFLCNPQLHNSSNKLEMEICGITCPRWQEAALGFQCRAAYGQRSCSSQNIAAGLPCPVASILFSIFKMTVPNTFQQLSLKYAFIHNFFGNVFILFKNTYTVRFNTLCLICRELYNLQSGNHQGSINMEVKTK